MPGGADASKYAVAYWPTSWAMGAGDSPPGYVPRYTKYPETAYAPLLEGSQDKALPPTRAVAINPAGRVGGVSTACEDESGLGSDSDPSARTNHHQVPPGSV